MSEEWITLQQGIANWQADGELPVQITSFGGATGSAENGSHMNMQNWCLLPESWGSISRWAVVPEVFYILYEWTWQFQ